MRETLAFIQTGTRLCRDQIDTLAEAGFAEPSNLPGWSRAHVVAHLCLNAEAIGRLLTWASTGVVTPMYASREQREADIEAGARRPAAELVAWFDSSAQKLDEQFDELTEAAWGAQVATLQGDPLPVRKTPWLRSREVLIHAVDLNTGLSFANLPPAFCDRLRTEILARRTGEQLPELRGEPAEITAYLAGRSSRGVMTAAGEAAPVLTAWI